MQIAQSDAAHELDHSTSKQITILTIRLNIQRVSDTSLPSQQQPPSSNQAVTKQLTPSSFSSHYHMPPSFSIAYREIRHVSILVIHWLLYHPAADAMSAWTRLQHGQLYDPIPHSGSNRAKSPNREINLIKPTFTIQGVTSNLGHQTRTTGFEPTQNIDKPGVTAQTFGDNNPKTG